MPDAAPAPHAGSSDRCTAIELLSEVVTWPVLVWFGKQGGLKNWVCDKTLYFFLAPRVVYSVPGAVGPRAAAILVALRLGNDTFRLSGMMEHATSSWTNFPN